MRVVIGVKGTPRLEQVLFIDVKPVFLSRGGGVFLVKALQVISVHTSRLSPRSDDPDQCSPETPLPRWAEEGPLDSALW